MFKENIPAAANSQRQLIDQAGRDASSQCKRQYGRARQAKPSELRETIPAESLLRKREIYTKRPRVCHELWQLLEDDELADDVN